VTSVIEHGHGVEGSRNYRVHTHAHALCSHSHLLRAICQRPECVGCPRHDIHRVCPEHEDE
jgi:hypothetical protein